MPIRNIIYPSVNLVLIICYDDVNDDHLVSALKQLYEGPDYKIGMNELVDTRKITDLNVTEKALTG